MSKPEHISNPLFRVLLRIMRNATPEQRAEVMRKTESIQQKGK